MNKIYSFITKVIIESHTFTCLRCNEFIVAAMKTVNQDIHKITF